MTSQPERLASGGLIDRGRTLSFSFDGKRYTGHPGDTLASALVANGVRLVGRSFKYHRPRGLLSAGPEEPNAIVELRSGARREPNTRATSIELFEGLVAQSQNRWPSLAFDVMGVNGFLSPFLSAGFYYKTFMWPKSFWEKVYEPLIRRAAGLGRASGEPDPDAYDKAFAHCDVLVIGAGPAGLMAALTAGRSGARVILAEQDFRLGGRLLDDTVTLDDAPAQAWVSAVEAELASLPEVRILRRTSCFGTYDQRHYGAIEHISDHLPEVPEHSVRQRYWRITANQTVLTAGAIERPLVFGDNDRPGIMLAGAVRSYINRYAAAPGRNAVIFATHDGAARTITDLAAAGIGIAAVIDPRIPSSAAVSAAARAADAPLYAGSAITRAHGGVHGVQAVDIAGPDGEKRISCDLVAMSGGWNPTIHLTSHTGHKPVWNPQIGAFVADRLPEGMRVAGAAAGDFSTSGALETGAAAGIAAAEARGFTAKKPAMPRLVPDNVSGEPLWRVRGATGKAFIDFQNDVTTVDVELADREGYRAIELMKRYTTLGMATDQGKTSNVAAIGIMAEITGKEIGKVGTTTFRPPFTPVAIAALAGPARGREFRPIRRTPGHAFAEEQGAVFVEAGPWLRAQYFPKTPDEDWLTAAKREVEATRNRVGYCDVSTLGKIDLQGRDSGVFLDRLYTSTFSTLPVGKVRYGLMLREDGLVLDDGTAARIAENRWLVTTTTANASRVMQHMEFCAQVLWPELDVQMISVTEQWAQVAVAGPHSRGLLKKLVDPGHDISNAAFPYMAAGDLTICGGVKARLYRISFSGELAYELAVPARFGDALMRAIAVAGEEFGALSYGMEALNIMRIEKGHAAGGELSGQITAHDLGLGKMVSTKKKDFIGRILANREAFIAPDRPALMGFRPVDHSQRISAGAHFIEQGAEPVIANDLGYITAATPWSTLGHPIGLGYIAGGERRLGQVVVAHDPVRGRSTLVEVCHPVFYDPQGERLRD